MQTRLRPLSPLLSHSRGSLRPTSTWRVFGFHVVDDRVLQGGYDALVGFLEGRNEVVHFPKEPPVDPGRCLRSQRVRGERGCWGGAEHLCQARVSVLGSGHWHRSLVLRNTHTLAGRSQPFTWTPDVPTSSEPMSRTVLPLPPGHRGRPALRAVSSSVLRQGWKRDKFLITTRETQSLPCILDKFPSDLLLFLTLIYCSQ